MLGGGRHYMCGVCRSLKVQIIDCFRRGKILNVHADIKCVVCVVLKSTGY